MAEEYPIKVHVLETTQFISRKIEQSIMQAVGREMLKEVKEEELLHDDVIKACAERCVIKKKDALDDVAYVYFDDRAILELGDIEFRYKDDLASFSYGCKPLNLD